MPWAKSFDEDAVVAKAMEVFWAKGYEATSINDLIESTGVGRGSLYNAFGGKRALFVRALAKYRAENHRETLAKLEALDDPLKAISGLFDAVLQETLRDQKKKGCFLVNTSLELWAHDQETRDAIKKGHDETIAFFRRCIEVGQARNQIPSSVEPLATAKVLLSLMISLRVLGRGAYSAKELQEISAQAMRLLA